MTRTATNETHQPVLRPGETCWRIAHADRVAVIIDAAAYYSHLKAAILRARHSILLIGWDFDPRVELERGDSIAADAPNRIGHLLDHVIGRNSGLRVYVLRWDLAFLKMPFRGTTPFFLLEWLAERRLHFHLDRHHPPGSCHHQKIVAIDDSIAFCGGIDVTGGRWDTPAHMDSDARRTHSRGSPRVPWHDVTTAVDGAAARAIGELARDRWFFANGWRPEPTPPGIDCWPDGLLAAFQNVDVGIARTQPAHGSQPAVREIETLYLAAIASAHRSIYLESQYFSAHRICEALERRLTEPDGPEVVVINPERAQGWLEEKAMGTARAFLLGRLRNADRFGRLRFCTPVTAEGKDIYVHAKVLVVDDKLSRFGSSNINKRSMGLDTECDLALEVGPESPNSPQVRGAIANVRDTLLAEHLGVTLERFEYAWRAAGGSLVGVLDALIGASDTTLVPFELPLLSAAERRLAETHVLDPHRPEPMARTFLRTIQLAAPRRATGALMLAATFAGIIAWRLRWRKRVQSNSPSCQDGEGIV